jgi:outer membrane receptor protein involved in Fe transport
VDDLFDGGGGWRLRGGVGKLLRRGFEDVVGHAQCLPLHPARAFGGLGNISPDWWSATAYGTVGASRRGQGDRLVHMQPIGLTID